jgi:hypothetical protein
MLVRTNTLNNHIYQCTCVPQGSGATVCALVLKQQHSRQLMHKCAICEPVHIVIAFVMGLTCACMQHGRAYSFARLAPGMRRWGTIMLFPSCMHPCTCTVPYSSTCMQQICAQERTHSQKVLHATRCTHTHSRTCTILHVKHTYSCFHADNKRHASCASMLLLNCLHAS